VSDDDRVALRERTEINEGREQRDRDALAVEAPLEIRISGVPVAVVMRTPGDDVDLVRGFLLTEGIARGAEVASIRHCTTVDSEREEDVDNVVQVVLAEGVQVDLAALRRNLFASSSCGVCGKASIEQAMRVAGPLDEPRRATRDRVLQMPVALQAAQVVFDQTGGLHAAGLFELEAGDDESTRIVAEDVGRHNAIDKVVGRAAAAGVSLDERVLAVSGRVSFEVVQKAVAARIPVLAAVSAPTSLAVDLARVSGLTLAAFVRGRRLCLYAGALDPG
jgi:FdhD protein